MTRRVHYEVEILYGCVSAPLCENNAGRDAIADATINPGIQMTDDETEVTCKRCLKALGYAEEERLVPVEIKELPNGRLRVAA